MLRRVSRKVKKIGAALALLSVEMTIVLLLFSLALLAFAFIVRRVILLHNNKFDLKVFAFLNKHISRENNEIMLFFTFLGTHTFLIPANLALIAYFLLIKKHKWFSIKVPAIAISSLALMFGLKFLFDRPRPLIPLLAPAKGLSFPSGHALMSLTFYGLLIVMLLLLILIIGFSRIYLRVHYASDVMAGYCVGLIWLVICVHVLNRIEKYSRYKLEPSGPHSVNAHVL